MDSNERQNRRDLLRRRAQEEKDLETERTIGQRPLEGFSHAHTTWTEEQDEGAAAEVHSDDEHLARERSERQIPPDEGER